MPIVNQKDPTTMHHCVREKKSTIIPPLFGIMCMMQKYFAFQEPILFEYLNI